MANVINVDNKKIQDLYKENDVYKAALELFSTRERSARKGVVNIGRVRRELEAHGTKVTREQMVSLFKKLQALKLGRIALGQGGKPARFLLSANLRSIGKVATGEWTEVQKHNSRTRLPHVAAEELSSKKINQIEVSTGYEHKFIVRKGQYELEIPSNITDAEIKAVTKILEGFGMAS